MVHSSKNKTLGRAAGPRNALLRTLSNALIQRKHLTTTLAKAKALARFIAPIITGARHRSEKDSQHAYKHAFAQLRNKRGVTILFDEIIPKIGQRPGGYTCIIKLQARQKGNGAQCAMIELVDFNPLLVKTKKAKTRRGRRQKTPKQPLVTTEDQRQGPTTPTMPPQSPTAQDAKAHHHDQQKEKRQEER